MVKIRLIPVLFIKNGLIVRSENFTSHKFIGNVVNEVRRYNQWDIDELIYIDISREKTYDSRRDDHGVKRIKSIDEILELVSKECFMPLTFGGGIRDFETIKKYLNSGADKVVVNTLLHTNKEIIKKSVKVFGSQAIVASIDYRVVDKKPIFYSENGKNELKISTDEMLDKVINLGCGEIFLNSIDRDGSGEGYDIDIISEVVSKVDIPVVACGGALQIFDFEEVSEIYGLSGIAAGNMFHFTENIYPRAKNKLKSKKINVR